MNNLDLPTMKSLPGYELVEQGLISGIDGPVVEMKAPEHQLYEKLMELDPEHAYGLYNSLIRRLVSFEST